MSRTVVIALLAGLLGAALATGTILLLYGPPGSRPTSGASVRPDPAESDVSDLSEDVEDDATLPGETLEFDPSSRTPPAPSPAPVSPPSPSAGPVSPSPPAVAPSPPQPLGVASSSQLAAPAASGPSHPPVPSGPPASGGTPAAPVAEPPGHPLAPPSSEPASSSSGDVVSDVPEVEEAPLVWDIDKESIHQALVSQMPKFKECYSAWAAMQPDLAGRLKIGFTIGRANPGDENASVIQADVLDSQLDNEFFQGCILRTVEDLKFVPPEGIIRVNIPYVFRQEE